MIDFEFVVFNDHNPFIVFDANSHIVYSNKSAEFLITIDSIEKLYNLALTYAPKSYGSKYSIVDISIDIFDFYAINVLYKDDNYIGIMLYNKPKKLKEIKLNGFSKSDINIILQANIEIFKLQSKCKLKLFSDFELPPFELHQNNLSLLIQKLFNCFQDAKELEISLNIKIGQKVIIENKKYNIVSLVLKNSIVKVKNEKELIDLAKKNYAHLFFNKNFIELDIPMIN